MLLLACAKHETPPALPDEPVVIDGFSSYTETSPVEIRQCASPEFRYMRGKKAVPMEESTGEESVPAKKIKPIDPEKLISTANSDARVKPTGTGYFGGRAMYRYQYNAGKIFDIHTNPGQFTNIYFPPGEHLATVPGLNPEKWEYGTGRIGSEGQQVEILRVRPLEPGLTVDIAVDMDSGRSYFLHLLPAKTAMLGVTWDLPYGNEKLALEGVGGYQNPPLGEKMDSSLCGGPRNGIPDMRMPVELAQLHTAYKIEVKGSPGFVPTQVADDARKTLIRLKAITGNAPAVFTYKPDGSRGLVQVTPYSVPNDPARGIWLIIDSIWPVIELVGTDGQSVRIIRLVEDIKIAEPWRRP